MRKTGKVTTVVEGKGYGFITPEGGDKKKDDIFYHNNNLDENLSQRGLEEGNKVSYEEQDGPKGKNAVNIKLIENDSE